MFKIFIRTYMILAVAFLILSASILTYNTVESYKVVPKIVLGGETIETLALNNKYNDPGYKGIVGNTDESKKVVVVSDVDTTKIGTYTIKYILKNNKGKNEVYKTRKVIVIDSESPTIQLLGDPIIKLYVNSKYAEPGYIATDNYDGDISNHVLIDNTLDLAKAGTYIISYSVKDTSGNIAAAYRTIIVSEIPKVVTKTSGVGIPILMYHFFYDKASGESAGDSNHLEVSLFEQHIKYLSDNNYYFPTWDELSSYIDGGKSLPSKSAIITVDDGDESFFRLAYPILKKYNVKATSFIVTSWTTPTSYSIDSNIITFGSHTNNMHRGGCSTGQGGLMRCIDYNKGYEDLMAAERIIGNSKVFCYPFGDYNDQTTKLLEAAGYKLAVTTKYGRAKVGTDKLHIPRIRITSSTGLNGFISIMR